MAGISQNLILKFYKDDIIFRAGAITYQASPLQSKLKGGDKMSIEKLVQEMKFLENLSLEAEMDLARGLDVIFGREDVTLPNGITLEIKSFYSSPDVSLIDWGKNDPSVEVFLAGIIQYLQNDIKNLQGEIHRIASMKAGITPPVRE